MKNLLLSLRNYSLFEQDSEASPRSFRPFAKERSSQSAAEAMDQNGVLFFGLMSDLAIACWNSITYPEYGGSNVEIMVVSPDTLQFPSGIKVRLSLMKFRNENVSFFFIK